MQNHIIDIENRDLSIIRCRHRKKRSVVKYSVLGQPMRIHAAQGMLTPSPDLLPP